LLSTLDIYPTLCGLCGLENPSGLQGNDLSNMFQGKQGKKTDCVYLLIGTSQDEGAWRGVRTKQHTYAYYINKKSAYVLYDNLADPFQMNNLMDKPENKQLQSKMHKLMVDWMKKVDSATCKALDNI
ncbi:MAG: DUF4976 domain-containing protein, partial [Anaerohalosphaera sp.]|nr:DUF4976 domain-containing protein [Anaerohalosphaera sp.]